MTSSCVQELRQLQQRPEAKNASVQASYAVHAVACQAGLQHSTAQAQLCSLQVFFIVSVVGAPQYVPTLDRAVMSSF